MKRICVFCGSSAGRRASYAAAARAFGASLARRGIGLVYGGSSVGLMGVVADAALAAGGEVVGVLPRGLEAREIGHPGLSELVVVGTMHERKATMAELSDGFVALPGGLGTLEELFEVWTWALLGVHSKPCGLLDVDGYYRPLVGFLAHAADEGLVRQEHLAMALVDGEVERLLDRLVAYRPPVVPVWIGPAAT